jgi:hypothetical protein
MLFQIIILTMKRLINWLRLKLSSDYKFLNPKEALLFSLRTGNQLKEDREVKEQEEKEKAIEKEKKRLLKDNLIYRLITEEVAKGRNYLYIESDHPYYTRDAINSIEELKAEVFNNEDPFQSGDVRVTWES